MKKLLSYVMLLTCIWHTTQPVSTIGLFEPYDLNIRLQRPKPQCFSFTILGEKSYNVKGYSVETECFESSFLTNPMQIYEPQQNVLGLYQGFTGSSQFTQLINNIAGGPVGGVNTEENGLFKPTGTFSAGQVALSSMYGLGKGFYVSAYLPFYFTKLSDVTWTYSGNNTLFSGATIQQQLVDAFVNDAATHFNLHLTDWKKNGLGDLSILFDWQANFYQRRPVLKAVQTVARLGITFPTGVKQDSSLVLSMPLGNDGALSIPFGGGLGLNLANRVELGFTGQFWYFWSTQQCRRIKSFPTQTSLLFPETDTVCKEYAFLQNFNLYAQAFSLCHRLALKFCYQYWRKGEDKLAALDQRFNHQVINSAVPLDEQTRHNVFVSLTYTPLPDDFNCVTPHIQLFWKAAFKGSSDLAASTFGGQLSLEF